MSVPERIANLAGQWMGTTTLWLSPTEPARESDTTMFVVLVAQGRFAALHYRWAFEGEPQDGLLVVGGTSERDAVHAFWIDSWHMGDEFMVCEGAVDLEGKVRLEGSYAAPPGPDWGWQIDLLPGPDGVFQLLMYNITPGGEAALAVEATYSRAG
jgi:hypothetical protein